MGYQHHCIAMEVHSFLVLTVPYSVIMTDSSSALFYS